jgi:excisionase family DNA binding protein
MSLPEMTTKNGETEILSVTEVARSLRCSKAHVYNAINGKLSGVSQLPAIPMGRRKLVRRTSLEAWKRANESGAPMKMGTLYSSGLPQTPDATRATERAD